MASSSHVTVGLQRNRETLEIDVRDDGPGIPDAEKASMLEPFARGDAARTMNGQAGFGLGLSIARAVAEGHGGSLSLHDAQPIGLIARMKLPADARSQRTAQEARRPR